MSRRVNLPGAAELFRVTDPRPAEPVAEPEPADAVGAGPVPLRRAAPERTGSDRAARDAGPRGGRRQPSGRERHDEKITVYISPEELHDLEHARLALRREHGIRADRGRVVREALAFVLSDLEANGPDSIIVRRFQEQ